MMRIEELEKKIDSLNKQIRYLSSLKSPNVHDIELLSLTRRLLGCYEKEMEKAKERKPFEFDEYGFKVRDWGDLE